MPSAWSATGAGAAEGLETLLKRFREEELIRQRAQQIAEEERSNKAREAQQGRALDENSAYRRMVEEDRRTAQQDALQGKRDTGATLGTKSLSVDQTISAPQYDAKYKGTVQEPNFQQQLPPETVGLAGTGFGGDKSAPRVADFKFRGTDEQREKVRDDAAVAAAIKDETLPEGVRGYLKVRGLFDKGAAPPAGLFTEPKETAGEDDRRYEKIVTNRNLKKPVTPEEDAWAKAYEKRRTLVGTASFQMNAPYKVDARSDRSYTQAQRQLDAIRKPLADQAERFSRLEESINQNTPQADALVAPELLTVMAGGQGSGLRMNEAEISRIIGGRSVWENLKASINHWKTDPASATSITPDQRQQIRALMAAVKTRLSAKLKAVDDAGDQLIDADDVDSHRKIIGGLRKKVDETNLSEPAPPTSTALPPGVTVRKIK